MYFQHKYGHFQGILFVFTFLAFFTKFSNCQVDFHPDHLTDTEKAELKVELGEGVYSGEHNGLTVLLDVEAYDYGYRPATGTGVYMVLNHHGDKPILSSGRVDLQVLPLHLLPKPVEVPPRTMSMSL